MRFRQLVAIAVLERGVSRHAGNASRLRRPISSRHISKLSQKNNLSRLATYMKLLCGIDLVVNILLRLDVDCLEGRLQAVSHAQGSYIQ
jgi:hypothetical protein